MRKKGIAIGVDDFKNVIDENCYFFDKSKFIEDILKDNSGIKLFTRPRRFGKTLTMSMVKYFFDVKNGEENRKLFDNLYISNTEYMKEQGQYPVVFLSFKDVRGSSWEEMKIGIVQIISNLYSEYKGLFNDFDDYELEKFENIRREKLPVENLKDSLRYMIYLLEEKYNKKVILLIDEYDTPLIDAHINKYYEEARSFFSTFYGAALKGNKNLKFGMITGIIRAVNSGIFSELNNLSVYTILDSDYSDSFGFTEDEVIKSMEYYGYTHKVDEVRKMYDGYKIGDSLVYNPWSITNYLKRGELVPYWVRTSGNNLIINSLKVSDKEMIEELEKLFKGESVEKSILLLSDLNMLLNKEDAWELMLFSGYLTVSKKIDKRVYELKIPNEEVREFFRESFIKKVYGDGVDIRHLVNYLLDKNIKKFEEKLQSILIKNTSFYDTQNENFYHAFVLGLMIYLNNRYIVKSNKESGFGRYDVVLEAVNKTDVSVILEFKSVDSISKLENGALEGLKQIKEKKYDEDLKLKNIDNIIYLSIAFYGKNIKIEYE
ncbi:AAA family ATPase [Pseudostreptobacillus hongkongensis]|uniref:AAA family ATPase n=1 Tax=Pseudostreptobacillus hongkongensis TaxID=1162717 RepID=UPI00082C8488|nr:AAA family ATPase [Pseudostreptobacillus hongkongensis]